MPKIIPFSSSRKRMTTIYKLNDHTYRILVKGASEVILKTCTRMVMNDKVIAIDE
jgi:Ca2+-transporting ATPase